MEPWLALLRLDGQSGIMALYKMVGCRLQWYTGPAVCPVGSRWRSGLAIGNHHSASVNNPFVGRIDEVSIYDRALTAAEVQGIYSAGSAGKSTALSVYPNATVEIPGAVTNTLFGTNIWQTTNLTFVAANNQTEVRLVGNPLGMLFDEVTLREAGNTAYYLPEESLDILKGENIKGDWKLEVWDNRAGGLGRPSLVSWELQFVVANTNTPVTVLTNSQNFSGTVSSNEIHVFSINVPSSATRATNLLSGTGDLVMLLNQGGVPTGDGSDDYSVDNSGAGQGETFLWTTSSLPVALVPGQKYYIGVMNANPAETNTFSLRVDFDRVSPIVPSVIPLTLGVPVTTNLPPGPVLQYYLVDIGSNSTFATFEIFNMSGNADLVIGRGLPLPNPTSWDYQSSAAGTSDENIIVTDSLFQVLPGRWYLGVYNRQNNALTYSVRVTAQFGPPTVIDLTSGIAYTNTLSPTTGFDYYHLLVSTNVAQLDFEILNSNGDVDLYASKDLPLPGPFDFDYFSGSAGPVGEKVTVTTNSAPVPAGPGDWYLGVRNVDAVPVTYVVRATETTNSVPAGPVNIDSIGYGTNGFTIRWSGPPTQQYKVQWSPVLPATWMTFTNIIASPTGMFVFVDDGSQTGGLDPVRFYKVIPFP